MKTVGELKTFLNTLPDDMPIVHYENGMEKRGYFSGAYLKTRELKKVTRNTFDAFDGTPYNYEAFEMFFNKDDKENLQLCLCID